MADRWQTVLVLLAVIGALILALLDRRAPVDEPEPPRGGAVVAEESLGDALPQTWHYASIGQYR